MPVFLRRYGTGSPRHHLEYPKIFVGVGGGGGGGGGSCWWKVDSLADQGMKWVGGGLWKVLEMEITWFYFDIIVTRGGGYKEDTEERLH